MNVPYRSFVSLAQSMRLDRATGAKCFLLSARALHIARGETTASWQWIDLRSDEIQENVRFDRASVFNWKYFGAN